MNDQIVEIIKALALVIGGGIGAKFLEYLVTRYSGRMTITLNDREELKKFIEDQRKRMIDLETRVTFLYTENSDLRVKLAMLQQERADWESREQQLLSRIQELEDKVKSLELDNKRVGGYTEVP